MHQEKGLLLRCWHR